MLQEINAKSILRKHKRIDSWFVSGYSINLYRGCTHNCVYCDGRDEKYQVQGEFGRDVSIKVNAIDVLRKELDPKTKRNPWAGGFFAICSGVSDSYQPFEMTRQFCRQTLDLLCRYRHPVHILTKSTLVERDIDILQKINEQNKAIVSFSFSSADDALSELLEPGVPGPSKRIETIKRLKQTGICCGMYLMPVVPFITDTQEMIETAVVKAKEAGVDFVIFGGMTLKPGRQKEYFMRFLGERFPELVARYGQIYRDDNAWGAPESNYVDKGNKQFDDMATRHAIAKRIPSKIFENIVSTRELIIVILEQLDYLATLRGKNSPYGYAAYSLSQIKKPIETMNEEALLGIKGVGRFTAKLIQEIIKTKRCGYYEELL